MHHFTFHCDAAHGWLEVPLDLLDRFKLQPSKYSYRNERSAYLEEDCDLGLIIRALDAAGETYEIADIHHRGEAFIRRLERFPDHARLNYCLNLTGLMK